MTRSAFATQRAFFLPRLPLGPGLPDRPPMAVERPSEYDALAGLDAAGQPVLVRPAFGVHGEAPAAVLAHPGESDDSWVIGARLLTWTSGRVEVVGFLTHDSVSHVTWVELDAASRPQAFATVGDPVNDLGQGAELAWCDWEGDRCQRVRIVRTSGRGGRWHASVRVAEYDHSGLLRVREGASAEPLDPDAAIAATEALVPDHVIWDRDRDAPEPDPLPPEAALDAWVAAVAGATDQIAAKEPDAVVVRVSADFAEPGSPFAVVVDRSALAPLAGRAEPREAVDAIYEPRTSLAPMLGDEGLRAWRSLRQQEVEEWQPEAAAALQRRLDGRPWLALVSGFGNEPWDTAERVLGATRVLAALGELPPAAVMPRVDRAPRDRAELGRLLAAFALPVELAELAATGFALVGGGGRSRLGGLPELPAGMSWPVCEGRPLVHLATLDLAELPEGARGLPKAGTLAFFADLTEEGELYEPVVVGEDERVRVVAVEPGTPTVPVEPPPFEPDEFDVPPVLDERRVSFAEVLTMPERPAALTTAEAVSYAQLLERLCEVTPGLWRPPHLVLGHPNVVQHDPRGDGQVNLLHIGWDPDLGFELLDGGDLTFYGDAADVAAGRWQRLTVDVASH